MYNHSAMKLKEDSKQNSKETISFYSRLSKKEKELFRKAANLVLPVKNLLTINDLINFEKVNKLLTINDLIHFEKIKEALSPLKDKYNLSIEELLSFVNDQLFIPTEIFNKNLTVLESVVKYLKEEKDLSLHKIAEIISRDERNIWHIYKKSKDKHPETFIVKDSRIGIPVSIFSIIDLSALESVVVYLKEDLNLTYHEIALLLKRDDRTIWTVYNRRARKKNE